MTRPEPPLIVAGWSTRAAAQSARRAGRRVIACDVFQDADLPTAAAECRRLGNLRDLIGIAADFPPGDWLFTGGLENHPAIVAAVSRRHRLLGNDAATLRRVRDPRALQRALTDGPAPLPKMRWNVPESSDDRTWLVKRRSSGGGLRIVPYEAQTRSLPRSAYLQEFVVGVPLGATYLAAGGRCRYLGLCRQRHAAVDPARPYLYGGSAGPVVDEPGTTAALVHLGETLAAEFPLRGLFGVDVIQQNDGSLRTLEVNPRYTASMELLERACGTSLVELHVRACREGELPEALPPTAALHAKRIVYVADGVPNEISPPLATALIDESRNTVAGDGEYPALADLPSVGSRPQPGEPFCTIFAAAATEQELEPRLNEQERRLRLLLQEHAAKKPPYADGDSASSFDDSRRRRAASSGS